MDVVSSGPLRVASVLWQPCAGAWALTVIVKATYRLEPLRSPLADVQESPVGEDIYWNRDPARSLYAPTDCVPFKRQPEVLLVGHAFAPGGKPVRSLMVRLQVGEVDKSIEVWCDRTFAQDGRLLEGPPFTKMPLCWERAAGGPGTPNPVGMPFDAAPDMYGRVAVPNLQPPGRHLERWGDTFESIGFGPLAPTWPTRAGWLSPEAAAGWTERGLAQPLPEGLDPGFFNAAPLDQRAEELRADERIVLEHLHPVHARLVTNLAGVKPRAVAERATGTREEVRLSADTLWIDTDRGVATLTWRGNVGLQKSHEAGRVVVWAEAGAAGGEDAGREPEGVEEDATRTITLPTLSATVTSSELLSATATSSVQPSATATSSVQPSATAMSSELLSATATSGVQEQGAGKDEAFEQTMEPPLESQSGPVLPFRDAPAAVEAVASGAGSWRSGPILAEEETAPVPLNGVHGTSGVTEAGPSHPSAMSALPFVREGTVAGAPAIAAPTSEGRTKAAPRTRWVVGTPSAWTAAPSLQREPDEAQGTHVAPDAARPRETPERPPLLGPLATPELLRRAAHDAASPPAPPSGAAPTTAGATADSAPEAAPCDFPIERCAAIAAEIAQGGAPTTQILEKHDLTPERWRAIEQRWTDELREEATRGKSALLKVYDAAYVARLEELRGPIQVDEYARLVVASERGSAAEALKEQRLPRAAQLRIERVWLDRIADDPELARNVRAALAAARAN